MFFFLEAKNHIYIYRCVCVRVCVFVTYEDTNLYKDMGMT